MAINCPKCQADNPDTKQFCGDCGTRLSASEEIPCPTKTVETAKEDLITGSTFAGRYQIIEELGKGGMGRVYKVLDKETKERIALKLIKPEIASNDKTIERFKNELTIARKIRHKNVCGMYYLGEDEGRRYITMEFVSGGDLKKLIRRTRHLPVEAAISIAKQICEGLDEAHNLGIVHRDLKPNNIMIDDNGNARIMDFGIARAVKEKGITGSGVMIGTPEYMSPEQVETRDIDQRSDIYSLGIILYEMSTGRLPFEGDTPLAVAMKHSGEIPENPQDINPQIPEDFSRIILRCLEKNREDRYQSAEEIKAELEKVEKGLPTTERAKPKTRPLTSREITLSLSLRKLFIPAFLILVLLAIVVLVWRPWSKKETAPVSSDKPSLAVLYFKNSTGDPSLDIWRSVLAESLISDLHQSKHINILTADRLFSILRRFDLLEAQTYATEDLEKIAGEGQSNFLLQGSFSRAGDTFRIETILQDLKSGEVLASERVEGTGEESFFSMVDELTVRIKSSLKISPSLLADDIDRNIGEITTSSPEALKYYSEGLRLILSAEADSGISSLEKAIDIDPDFAMAYRILGAAYSNAGDFEKFREFTQKAMELSDRVSDREKYIIQGTYFGRSEKTWDKAIEAYKKLLDLYPDDLNGNANLASLYSRIGESDKASELSENARLYFPRLPAVHCNSAYFYYEQGLYEKGEEILNNYEKRVSENEGPIKAYLAFSYLFRRDFDRALSELNKSLSLIPSYQLGIILKGDTYLCRGDFIQAEKEFSSLLSANEASQQIGRAKLGALSLHQGKILESVSQIEKGLDLQNRIGRNSRTPDFNLLLAYLYMRIGDYEKALDLCEKALSYAIEKERSDWQRWALYYMGLTLVKNNSIAEAQRKAEELQRLSEQSLNKKEIRWFYLLSSLIESEKKSYANAVDYLNKAYSLLNFEAHWFHDTHALFSEPLAKVYFYSGDLEKAREEFEKIISLTYGRIYFGDIYGKSYYMLGIIHQELGDQARARDNYEKFLDLWKHADPDFPEVEDARKRLAVLKSQ